MGYKTVKFAEFDQRVTEYWHPSDFDQAALSRELSEIEQGWNGQGFVKLAFDDETWVLTGIFHRVANGEQVVWETGESPAAVIAAQNGQAAAPAPVAPASWDEMWQTYNGWPEYQQYAASRYMQENTDFLNAVTAYRAAPSAEAAAQIRAQFVGSAAPQQINISSVTQDGIEARDDGGADIFDEAEAEVIGPLRDDWAGFESWYAATYG